MSALVSIFVWYGRTVIYNVENKKFYINFIIYNHIPFSKCISIAGTEKQKMRKPIHNIPDTFTNNNYARDIKYKLCVQPQKVNILSNACDQQRQQNDDA